MSETRRILRFLAVGGLNTAFSYTCFLGLHLLGAPLWAAIMISTVLGVLFNFMSFGALVFRPARGAALVRFILLYTVIASINYFVLRLLTALTVPPWLGQAICLPVLAFSSYLGMRWWVYAMPDASHERNLLL